MLIKYTNLLTLATIKRIIKIKNIRRIGKFNKNHLLFILNYNNAATIIQRKFRTNTITYTTCPISFEPLKYPYISIKINNKFMYYNFFTLFDYFVKTQDLKDPLTRIELNDKKIMELNKLSYYYNGKNTTKILISDSMIKTNEMNIIIYCIYDVIIEINQNLNLNLDNIYYNYIPRLIYYINKLLLIKKDDQVRLILVMCRESINCDIIKHYVNHVIENYY